MSETMMQGVFEGDVSLGLEVDRQRLRDLRSAGFLSEGSDWFKGDGGRVMLTRGGILEAMREFGVSATDLPLGIEKKLSAAGAEASQVGAQLPGASDDSGVGGQAPPAASEGDTVVAAFKADIVELSVVKLPKNPKILHCVQGKLPGVYVVRVNSNKNFKPGMVLKARRAQGDRIWYLDGRAPRWRGRW